MKKSNNEEINILCCGDDNFIKYNGITIISLLKNVNQKSKVKIHFFTNSKNKEELKKLENIVKSYKAKIRFYDIDEKNLKNLKVDGHVSSAAYFRLLAIETLPDEIEKIIYFDGDIIINGNITELWEQKMKENTILAHEVKGEKRSQLLGTKSNFNSGVMVINVKKWKEERITKRTIDFIENNKEIIKSWDEDGLNCILDQKWGLINPEWNKFPNLCEFKSKPKLIHFIGAVKPWHKFFTLPGRKEFDYYKSISPWRKDRKKLNLKIFSLEYIRKNLSFLKRNILKEN